MLRGVEAHHKLLLCLGVGLLPLYVFPSGSVQPYHAVLAVFAGLVILSGQMARTVWLNLLAGTVAYIFAVEAIYTMLSGSPTGLIAPVFLLYNTIIAAAVYSHVNRQGAGALALGIVVAAAVTVVAVLIVGVDFTHLSDAGRPTGTFNNPNQLGFFSTCLVSISYVLYRLGYLKYLVYVFLVLSATYLAVASLSKAAILATASVVFISTMPRGSRFLKIAWLGVMLAALSFGLYKFSAGALDRLLFVQRLYGMATENDSSLASRGYFQFLDANVAQILFGLGEHNIRESLGREVHSTFAGMLNNYGLAGLLLLLSVFGVWLRELWRSNGALGVWCIAGPSILYGLTHNGIRFTFFWLLFASSLALAHQGRRRWAAPPSLDVSSQRSSANALT